MKFFKRFDIYEPNLTFYQTKSGIRGFMLVMIIISFLIYFAVNLYQRITNPSILTTYEMKYLSKDLFKIDPGMNAVNLKFTIVPHFTDLSTTCTPKVLYSIENKTSGKDYDPIIEKFDLDASKNKFVLSKNFPLETLSFTNIFEIVYEKECQDNLPFSILIVEYDSEVFHNHIIENSNKLQYFKSSFTRFMNFTRTEEFEFTGLLNILSFDYKTIFDGNSIISDNFKYNFKNNEKFINPIDSRASYKLTKSNFDVGTNYLYDYYIAVSLVFDLNYLKINCFLLSFENPISNLPIFFSIFSIFLKLSSLLVKLLYINYKAFSFLNNYCDIVDTCDKRVLKNQSRTNFSNETKSNINESTSKDIKEYKSIESSINLRDNIEIVNSEDIQGINPFKVKLVNEKKGKCRYSYKDMLLMFVPCRCILPKLTNSKKKILDSICQKIKIDYDSTVSDCSLYSFFVNYRKIYGDAIFQEPLFKYNISCNGEVIKIEDNNISYVN